MKDAPITISPELAAKYDGEGQFDAFDKAFTNFVKADPAAIPPLPEEEGKKPRGRPGRIQSKGTSAPCVEASA